MWQHTQIGHNVRLKTALLLSPVRQTEVTFTVANHTVPGPFSGNAGVVWPQPRY